MEFARWRASLEIVIECLRAGFNFASKRSLSHGSSHSGIQNFVLRTTWENNEKKTMRKFAPIDIEYILSNILSRDFENNISKGVKEYT